MLWLPAAALERKCAALKRECAAQSGGENARAAFPPVLACAPPAHLLDMVTVALDEAAARPTKAAVTVLARAAAAAVLFIHDEKEAAQMRALLPPGRVHIVDFGQATAARPLRKCWARGRTQPSSFTLHIAGSSSERGGIQHTIAGSGADVGTWIQPH